MAQAESTAADNNSIDKLKSQLEAQIHEYEDSLEYNRNISFRFKLLELLLAGATTVLIGFSSSKLVGSEDIANLSVYFSATALVTSAALTIVTGLENFRGYRDNWVRYSNTWSSLRLLNGEFERKICAPESFSARQLDDIAKRFDKILADSHAGWGKARGKGP